MSNHEEHHIVGTKVYLAVFGSLMILTAATVAAAFMDLGALNTPVALTIACVKMTLVILYFMHVRYSQHLVKVFAGAGFLWLVILLVFLFGDYFSRNWIQAPRAW
jgi:cytochrome c oxidase subunit 4